jgi:positive regulator of sigma E activity
VLQVLPDKVHSVEERATVIETLGDKVRLSLESSSLCARCGSCRRSDEGLMILECDNTIGAKVNDRVLVRIAPSGLKISALLYGIPSLLLVTGILLGYFLFHSELIGIAAGSVFLVLSLLLVCLVSRKYRPRLERIVD